MVRDESTSGGPSVDLTRRKLLGVLGGGTTAALAGKVGYEYTGFGTIGGTNLVEQDLAAIARRNLSPTAFELDIGERRVWFNDDTLVVKSSGDGTETVAVGAGGRTDGSTFAAPIENLASDLDAIAAGDVGFVFERREEFFDRVRGAEPRPLTVAALRGSGFSDPAVKTVRAFADVDPRDVRALVPGLAEGFRDRTHFDVSRYLAGSIETIFPPGSVSIQDRFNGPTDFNALLDEQRGLYCYEYALRSVEAFHAIPPRSQTPPVFAGVTIDTRHDHAYTLLASVVREAGNLIVAVTFLDYFYATLINTIGARWVFGEGIGAYDRRHRATSIHYENPYA